MSNRNSFYSVIESLKNRYFLVGSLLLQVCVLSALSQNPKVPTGTTEDLTENVNLSTINFDDYIFSADNSVPVSPNRYIGVSFYAQGTQTWLTRLRSLSFPNSLIVGYNSFFSNDIYSVNNLVIEFAQPAKDVAFWWGLDGSYPSGTIQIYNEGNQLVNTIPVNLSGSWVSFSLNQFSQNIKKVVLTRANVSNNLFGHIYLENVQFTPVPNVQSVSIDSINTFSSVSDIGTEQRIFPDKHSPNETVDRRTVRVTANVGQPNVTVYFKNIDVDDPSSESAIDENGSTGNDNRDGRNVGQAYPASAAGVLSATSATTNSSGVATVFFTVTRQPGDNFRIAASTDSSYLTGVVANGTGLKDAANNSLPTAQAKQSKLLTVWRKVHLEVDSMGPVVQNYVSGFVRGKGKYVTSQPTWIEVYPTTGPLGEAGSLPVDAYKETKTTSGTRVSYGGRIVLDGAQTLLVLDNREVPRASGVPPGSEIEVVSVSGDIYVRPNQPFRLYDDDDFNDTDGPYALDGDDLEDITSRSDTFSLLQPSPAINANPFAAAYIEPDYLWAEGEPGMNDSDVQYETIQSTTIPNHPNEGIAVNRKRDSSGMENNDFWIGYLLVGYQSSLYHGDPIETGDPLTSGLLGGTAPCSSASCATDLKNSVTDSRDIPLGSFGAVVYIEQMRDWDLDGDGDLKIVTAPHELGHQFGLAGDVGQVFGIMTDTSQTFVSLHLNLMRWRKSSPGY